MSCRTTAAGSAITSFARIANGPGQPLSDVATLSLFHNLRRQYQSLRPAAFGGIESAQYQARFGEDGERELALRDLLHRMPYGLRDGVIQDDGRINIDQAYTNLLNSYEQQILEDTTLTEARKASLLARITAARSAETPDAATLYALSQMSSNAESARSSQQSLIQDYARTMEVDEATALARYRELENSIERARDAETDEYYTSDNRNLARQAGIVDEAGAVRAFTTMRAEIRDRRITSASERPRLIDSFNTFPTPERVENTPYEIIGWAQDRRSGHTEFQLRNVETGETVVNAYRLSGDLAGAMRGDYRSWTPNGSRNLTPGEYWRDQIEASTWNRYRSDEEALEAGAARRCALCGQFANISHTCPDRFNNAPRYVINSRVGGDYVRTSTQRVEYEMPSGEDATGTATGTFEVQLPLVNDYRAAFRENGLMLLENVSGSGDWRDRTSVRFGDPRGRRYSRVTGDLALIRAEDGTITANTETLTCTCPQYATEGSCIHQTALANAAILRANPPTRSVRSMTPEERERLAQERQAVLEAASASDWTRNEETLTEAKKTWATNSEVSYFEDYDAFKTVYNAAVAEKEANGKPSIPYIKENALGGLATRATGQGFGVELEYDFPDTMSHPERREAEEKIGRALKAANITPTAEKQGYHAAARNGYKDTHVDENGKGTWSWEHDGSVAGEIVTPTMYDEPETWEKLEKVVEILKANGAVPSIRSGAHVHVGTGALFGSDPKKYSELAKIYSQHEDVVYRLATDPERGTHRGIKTNFGYASPNPAVAPSGFADATAVKRWQGHRTRALNLNSVYFGDEDKKSHVEFRIFDATLDAAAIQAQVKVAVAMTAAAARIADSGETKRSREALGVHSDRAKARGRRRPTEDDIKDETTTFRSLMDTLFSRAEDKEQVTKLFAASSWVKLTAGQKSRLGIR
jgi:hypothetical protein